MYVRLFCPLILLAGMVGRPGPGRAASCGDLNEDGELTIADAVRLQRAVFVPSAADCGGLGSDQCGDVNLVDGDRIGPTDVVALLNALAGRPNHYGLCGAIVACDGPAQLHVVTPSSPNRLVVEHGIFFLITSQLAVLPSDPASPGPDPGIVVKYGLGLPDSQTDLNQFVPTNTALVRSLAMDCHALDPFLETTDYVGALDPNGSNWLTSPWISLRLH